MSDLAAIADNLVKVANEFFDAATAQNLWSAKGEVVSRMYSQWKTKNEDDKLLKDLSNKHGKALVGGINVALWVNRNGFKNIPEHSVEYVINTIGTGAMAAKDIEDGIGTMLRLRFQNIGTPEVMGGSSEDFEELKTMFNSAHNTLINMQSRLVKLY